MMMHRIFGLVALGAAFLAMPTVGGAQPKTEHRQRRVGLDECVRMALRRNHEMERADATVDEAVAARRSIRGRFGPILQAEAGIQRWDAPSEMAMEVPISIPGMPPIPPITMEVQDQTTKQLSFTAIQPITGLWGVYEGHRALSYGEDAARHGRRATRNDVIRAVADAYFQALGADKFAEIAEVSVRQIEAHVERARSFHRHDLIGDDKMLEAEVRLAEGQAMLIKAQGAVTLARSALAFRMGLPATEQAIPAPVDAKEAALTKEAVNYEVAASQAVRARPELAALGARVQQADAGVNAAWAQMIPQVSLLASAQYAKGISFQRESQYFVGATASWNFWEWGSTYYGIDQARARARQAKAGQAQLREAVRLEVRQALVEQRIAKQQLEVMRRAAAQAAENLRLVERRFAVDASTSTDVLDAVALQARAQAGEATAYYDYLRARVALRRARGQRPVGNAPGGGR